VRVSIWADNNGVPSEIPFDQQWISEPAVTRVMTGGGFLGPHYGYSVEAALDVPGPGRFWFSATPSSQGSSGQSFWRASAVPSEFGTSYFRSEFFGFPTWSPVEDFLGDNYDFAFTLTLVGGDCNTNGCWFSATPSSQVFMAHPPLGEDRFLTGAALTTSKDGVPADMVTCDAPLMPASTSRTIPHDDTGLLPPARAHGPEDRATRLG